jgi:heat shock protein HspQ
MTEQAKFQIGELVEHQLFGYRGVIFDVDATFNLTDEWYEAMAKSCPPKDIPWYHVMVHNAAYTTYVAQQNLLSSAVTDQISHPELGIYFGCFIDGRYQPRNRAN